jgi:hypothetical protein
VRRILDDPMPAGTPATARPDAKASSLRPASSRSTFRVTGSQSTSRGIAPRYRTISAVAAKVSVGTSTASPAFRPRASTARWRAAVHEFTATAWGAPTARANSSSKRFTRGPVVSHPERSVATTSSISASEMLGRKKGTGLLMTLL